jgi:hypothetical protein
MGTFFSISRRTPPRYPVLRARRRAARMARFDPSVESVVVSMLPEKETEKSSAG